MTMGSLGWGSSQARPPPSDGCRGAARSSTRARWESTFASLESVAISLDSHATSAKRIHQQPRRMFAYDTLMLCFLLCAMLAPQADNLSARPRLITGAISNTATRRYRKGPLRFGEREGWTVSKTAPYHGQDFEYRTSSHRSTGV